MIKVGVIGFIPSCMLLASYNQSDLKIQATEEDIYEIKRLNVPEQKEPFEIKTGKQLRRERRKNNKKRKI